MLGDVETVISKKYYDLGLVGLGVSRILYNPKCSLDCSNKLNKVNKYLYIFKKEMLLFSK